MADLKKTRVDTIFTFSPFSPFSTGGSGTLNEIAVAYQLNIPIISISNTGGWADKLANQYLDDRKRFKIISAKNSKEAVDLAFKLARKQKLLTTSLILI